ncbi:MAG: translocation/assembly module TamB domain-containing protein, partial [Thermoanaerobaculia bacterium]
DIRSDDLGTLAELLSPEPLPDFTGSLLGTLEVEADFSAGDYQAVLRLADLRLTYEGRTINSLEPVVAELTPERVTVRSLYLGEQASGTELFATGTVGLGETTPLDLRFQGTFPAVWAELALPDWEVEGTLDVLGAVRGTAANPLVNGQGELSGGQVIVPNFPQAFEDINALLSFNRDRVVLEQLQARLGNGTVLANGSLILPGEGRELSYRVNTAAEGINFRFPEGVLNRGDAEVALVSTDVGRLLSGRIALDRTLDVEDVQIELLQLLQNAFQRERLEVEETNELLATTELNLVVDGPDALRVRNNVANLQGDIDLVVRGTLARPVVFGEIEVDEGTLVFSDNEYEVERGLLTFSNPNRIDPVIDLVAQTRIQGFDISLNIGGTLENLDVDFASDANLADLEIVSLIATGQRPGEEAGRELTAEGEQVGAGQIAQQILAGEAASAVTRRFGTLFGLDRFRINPVSPGVGQPVSGVGVTVGKRLSRDIFVTYTSDPDPNRQYIVQVEWQVQRNLLLVLTQEGDDSYAIDLQWQRRF